MTGNASDAQIDRLVKAGWLKMGLSPRDLADVLDAVLQPRPKQHGDEGHVGADRLTEIGHALDMPIDAVRAKGPAAGLPEAPLSPVDVPLSVLSMLELRLLRAFCQLQDPRTRQLLIHLAEQLVKRQSDRGGDAA